MPNPYDILYRAGLALAAPVWLTVPKSRRKVLDALSARMGRQIESAAGAGPLVLLHAVSLGEVNATRALVARLHAARPDLRIAISATTATGHARATELYAGKPGLTVLRFPLDFSSAIHRLLDALRPSLVALMELEVWPNFMLQCARRHIPVLIINARLTPHSQKRYRWIAPLARRMFRRLSAVAAQDSSYARQFIALGVPAERVTVTGTMKFDTAEITSAVAGAEQLARDLDLRPGEPLLIAGSTGPGEEPLILDAYRDLFRSHPTLRLAIIPRHPDRFEEVATLIQQSGHPLIRRSHKQHPTSDKPPVLLGDTMGELRKFYSLATVVLVGRTLLDLGPRQRGSDMIEPAALSKPTIVGPWTHNFAEPMAAFRQAAAIVELAAPKGIAQAVSRLLADPADAKTIGDRARQVVSANQGATARHAEMILAALALRDTMNA